MKIKNEKLKMAFNLLFLIVGTFIMAVGFSLFLAKKDVAGGGFSGIALLISRSLEEVGFSISSGLLTFILNIPLFIVAIKRLGSRFGAFSIIGVVSFSVFLDVVSLIQLDINYNDILLCTIYGGTILGIGTGIVIKVGGSTGGSDMLANLIVDRRPTISAGTVIFAVDAVVVFASIFVFGFSNSLYSFIAILISSVVMDYVMSGFRSARAFYIISDKGDEIADKLMERLKRGVTAFYGKGMYNKKDKKILMTIVTRTQVAELRRIIFLTDPSAFIFSSSVKEVIGEGFEAEKETIIEEKTKKQKKNKRVDKMQVETLPKNIGVENPELKNIESYNSEE